MWRSLFGGPKGSGGGSAAASPDKRESAGADRFTLKHLTALHGILVKERAAPATAASDARLIDTVKQLSEMMVYGDKHDEKFFECVGRCDRRCRMEAMHAV